MRFLFISAFVLCSVYSEAQVKPSQAKYPTLFGTYPEEVVNAYASANPKTTIAALENNLASFEQSNIEDFFLLANYRLFLAHMYEVVYKHESAVPHYKKADEYLSKASFLPKKVEENIRNAMANSSDTMMQKNIKILEQNLAHKDDWQKLRRAYLHYVELGQSGDAVSLQKGEELIKQLGNSRFVEKRNLYTLKQTNASAAAGAITFEFKTLHPNQVELNHDYYMPYLKDMQVYSITIKNNSSSLLVLNSNDFILKSGTDSIQSVAEDKIAPYVFNTLAMEQFTSCELNPITVSHRPVENFNQEIIGANVEAFVQIEKAKEEAWIAKIEADRAARQAAWAGVGSGLLGISQQGLNFNDYLKRIGKTREEVRLEFAPQALKRVKTALTIRMIAATENIAVTEEELDAEVERVLEVYKDAPEQHEQIRSEGARQYLSGILRNRKIITWLKNQTAKKSR